MECLRVARTDDLNSHRQLPTNGKANSRLHYAKRAAAS